MRLKDILIESNIFLKLNKIISFCRSYYNFKRVTIEKTKCSIFDYILISQPQRRLYTDYIPENNDKCMSNCLKNYMGINPYYSLDTMIEHGLFFGDYVAPREYKVKVPSIITFGEQRKEHLLSKHINKKIILIGPYIHYAHPLLSATEYEEIKKRLGRILLVFPSHSLPSEKWNAQYDINSFASEIKKVSKDYDTVLISLHYGDIALASQYEKYGYICVTSGHTNDPNFMNRQRSLIELADMTMSNSVGTHVGYCIYLNKPHYIYKQKIEQASYSNKNIDSMKWRDINIYNNEVNEVLEAFNSYHTIITNKQRQIINKYWGTEHIKTPEELRNLIQISII